MDSSATRLAQKHKLSSLSETMVNVLLTQIEKNGLKKTVTFYEKKAKKEEENQQVYAELAKLAGLLEKEGFAG